MPQEAKSAFLLSRAELHLALLVGAEFKPHLREVYATAPFALRAVSQSLVALWEYFCRSNAGIVCEST